MARASAAMVTMLIQTCTLMLKTTGRTHDAQIYPSHEMARVDLEKGSNLL